MKNLHFKAMNGQMTVDEAQGIVECFVAAIGNKDSVGDIIIPGAFNASFKKRKPRVVWGHDWNQPIGKVLEIYEVGPNDPRLPGKMKQAGVGGVFAKVQFNLNSERGREAFANILFFGEEQEWSIGYKTLDAVWDPGTQANILKELELYEVSPVLHGANQLTATISIKDAKGADSEKDEITSLRDSKWDTFDIAWAKKLKDEHPDIWSKGGNIKGNDQWRILTQIAEKGKATTQAELNALKLREAWIARHKGDFRLAGVVAQIKWLAVGTRGEAYMKNLIRDVIDRKNEKGYWDDDLSEKGESLMGVRAGSFVRWDSSGGTAYGKVLKIAKGGTIAAKPSGPTMRGTEDNPAVEVQVWRFRNGSWDETDTVTVHRFDALRAVDSLPDTKAAPSVADLDALTDAVGLDPLPQERVTGDVLRGYGPRRGNLERLLRYWRPIMRKPGGFRRCRVILADHPELYPLENLCAWLHHETTGLWPNEGCHHPGMKNCRRKMRGIVNGSVLSDAEFNNRLRRLGKKDDWGYEDEDESFGYEYWAERADEDDEDEDAEHELFEKFARALRDFVRDEPEFIEYLENDDNWVHEGQEHDEDDWHEHPALVPMGKKPCGCGGGCGGKSADDDLLVKAGRTLSGRNKTRLRDAVQLIKSVIDEADMNIKEKAMPANRDKSVSFKTDDPHGLVTDIAPVVRHHGLNVKVVGDRIEFQTNMSDEAKDALSNVLDSLGYDAKGFLRRIGGGLAGGGRGGRGGGKGPRVEAYDPNADDGDGDGIAQEGTTAAHPVAPKAVESVAEIIDNLEAGGFGMFDAVSRAMRLNGGDRPDDKTVGEMIDLIYRGMSGKISRADKGRLVNAGLWEFVNRSDGNAGPSVKPVDAPKVRSAAPTIGSLRQSIEDGDMDVADAVASFLGAGGKEPDEKEVQRLATAASDYLSGKNTDAAKQTLERAGLLELVESSPLDDLVTTDDSTAVRSLLALTNNRQWAIDDDKLDELYDALDGELTELNEIFTGRPNGEEVFEDGVDGAIVRDKTGRLGIVNYAMDDEPYDPRYDTGGGNSKLEVVWVRDGDGNPILLTESAWQYIDSDDIENGKFKLLKSQATEDLDAGGFANELDYLSSSMRNILKEVRGLYGSDPEAAMDILYSLKGRVPTFVYESLLARFNKDGAKSLRLGSHSEWMVPVVKAHNIPYAIKGDNVMYDLRRVNRNASDAFGVAFKRAYSEQQRTDLADRGMALPDGSYPIRDKADLKNAISAFGRAKNKSAAKAHIIKRARQLKATAMLPEGWL